MRKNQNGMLYLFKPQSQKNIQMKQLTQKGQVIVDEKRNRTTKVFILSSPSLSLSSVGDLPSNGEGESMK